MWFFYNILFFVGYMLLLPQFFVRMCRRGGYRRHFMERFGVYPAEKKGQLAEEGRIWIHAVSVGEAQLALAFMQSLLSVSDSFRFVLSATTSTGYALFEKRKRPEDVLIYYPMDFPMVVRRVFKHISPRAFILMECELWPNLLRGCAKRHVPVWVVNGRVSEKSFRGYQKVGIFFRRASAFVHRFLVQTPEDAERLRKLGVEHVEVLGSAKFDLPVPSEEEKTHALSIAKDAGLDSNGLFWVMGSTWPGEEGPLLDIFMRLRKEHPSLQAILVPRHAERGNEVEQVIRERAIPYVRRSQMDAMAQHREEPAVLLADSTGELAGFYMLADIVFVGKSLAGNRGGQNPAEPASMGKPVITGNAMDNFSGVMRELCAANAVLVAADFSVLERMSAMLLADKNYREKMGARAASFVRSHRGVMQKSAQMILDELQHGNVDSGC